MILTKYNRELAHQMVDSAPDGHASAGINFDIKTDQPDMFNNECEGMCGV